MHTGPLRKAKQEKIQRVENKMRRNTVLGEDME